VLLKLLPRWLYDRLFAHAPHKPRGLLASEFEEPKKAPEPSRPGAKVLTI